MLESGRPPSTVKSVMAKPVVTIDKDCSVYEAAKLMNEKGIGSIVVLEDGEPIGIATERDILQKVVAKGLNPSLIKIEEIMSRNLISVGEKTSLINAIRIMEKNKVRRLLVMEKGKLVGIITQRDLLRALAFHVIISFRPLFEYV